MAKTEISVYFTASAPGYKGKVTVCSADASGKRKYMRVQGIDSSDIKDWDKNLQMFLPTTKANIENNAKLMEMRIVLELLIRTRQAKDSDQLFTLYKEGKGRFEEKEEEKQANSEDALLDETLGDFLGKLVEKLKTQGLSRAYQLYQTLYHNLDGISRKSMFAPAKRFKPAEYGGVRLFDTPISKIGNEHLAAFADWVKNDKGGANYRNLTVNMMATLRRAQEEGKNKNNLTYSFSKNAPKKVVSSLSGAIAGKMSHSLTPDQIKAVFDFDVSTIKTHAPQYLYWNQLYLDTTKLMYLLLSRPADVVSMTWDMVVTCGANHFLYYIPYKKRGYNNAENSAVKVPIPDEAMQIMLKYKGKSKTNAILPFPDNNKRYDIHTPEGAQEWSKALARSIRKVDTFLKHVGKALGLRWLLSLYAFRRSAITHSLESGQNVMKVAKRAGTGLAMIDKHYYQDQGIV